MGGSMQRLFFSIAWITHGTSDGLKQQHLCQKYKKSQAPTSKYWTTGSKASFLKKSQIKHFKRGACLQILSQSYCFAHASYEILVKINNIKVNSIFLPPTAFNSNTKHLC